MHVYYYNYANGQFRRLGRKLAKNSYTYLDPKQSVAQRLLVESSVNLDVSGKLIVPICIEILVRDVRGFDYQGYCFKLFLSIRKILRTFG